MAETVYAIPHPERADLALEVRSVPAELYRREAAAQQGGGGKTQQEAQVTQGGDGGGGGKGCGSSKVLYVT